MYLGAMRRARQRRQAYEASCPCKQVCRCHHPAPDDMPAWAQYAFIGLLLAIIPGVIFFSPPPGPQRRTIQVRSPGGRVGTCDLVWVKTGQTCEDRLLHHECRDTGYDEAQCR